MLTQRHSPQQSKQLLTQQKNKLLSQRALDEGYGYKTANLMELASLINQLKTPGTTIAIPCFVGITHKQVLVLLEKTGLSLEQRWDDLINKHFPTDAKRDKILETQQLPESFFIDLILLQKEIKASCKKAQQLPYSSKLEALLMQSKNNNWRLMVRSSGQEDTDTLANAGGNHTECNIAPQKKAILNALGKVVASYFGKRSILQRLQAGDKSLFTLPLIPVLLQRMIGEQEQCLYNEIPVGCVAYSQEVEGDTPGVTTIQASFGHNEGVVESCVALDTYHVDEQQNIFSSIKKKYKRMAPDSSASTLTYLKNPEEIVATPTLSLVSVKAIDHLLRTISFYYKKAMDLELVYEPKNNTIYLVQARPIVIAQKASPSYLESITNCVTIPCIPVCSNGGSTVTISDKEQVLAASTLNKALNQYNELGKKKDLVRVIVVAQEAEPTSHAAAVFRGEGKLVLKLTNKATLATLDTMLNAQRIKLYADPQRHLLVHTKNNSNIPICNGWLNHPLPAHLTINETLHAQQPAVLYDKFPQHSYQQLLSIMQNAPQQTAVDALTSLTKKVNTCYIELCSAAEKYTQKSNGFLSYQAYQACEKLQTLQQNIWHIATLLRPSFILPANNIKRLFYIRFMEALLLQQPSPSTSNQYSVTSCIQQFYGNVTFFEKTVKPLLEKRYLSQTLLLDIAMMQEAYDGCKVALNQSVTRKWLTFLDKFRAYGTDEQHAIFHQIMGQIKATNLLSCWLNASFIESYKRFSQEPVRTRTIKCFNRLKREFHKTQPLLAIMQQHQQYQTTIAPALWQNPKTFPEQLKRFNQEVLSFFTSQQCSKLLNSRNKNILQKASLSTMLLQTVETFDQLIKQMKGSTLYQSIETKNRHFKNALFMYLQLLKQFNVEPKLLVALEHALHNALLTDKNQLINSKRFNVNNVICLESMSQEESIDARQREVHDLIITLEDLFTSIHQLLLLKISNQVVLRWKLNKTIAKPVLLTKAERALKLNMALTGIRFDNKSVTYRYNKKLRAHSVSVELIYTMADQSLAMKTCFYGDNEYSRWHIIKDYLSSASDLKKLKLSSVDLHDTGLSFTVHLDEHTPCSIVKKLLKNSIATTLRLGIEHRKKMYFETRNILEKLTHHLELLAGGKQQLLNYFATKQKLLDDLNVLALPLFAHSDVNNEHHNDLMLFALKEALDCTKEDLLDVLPVNFYLYQQVSVLLGKTTSFDANKLNKIFYKLDKKKRDKTC